MRAGLLALLLASCGDPPIPVGDCVVGSVTTCVCPEGMGTQTCTAQARVGPCVCADGGTTRDASADARD